MVMCALSRPVVAPKAAADIHDGGKKSRGEKRVLLLLLHLNCNKALDKAHELKALKAREHTRLGVCGP